MKVLLKISTNEYDDTPTHNLEINGEESATITSLSECPEDAIVGRDLIDGKDIIKYIKMGFEAGKRNEELIIEEVKL